MRICRDILECYVSGDIVSDAYVALMEEKVVRVHVNFADASGDETAWACQCVYKV